MPIEIRTLAPTFTAAGYRFHSAANKAPIESWPWLRLPSNTNNLCENCSRLNFRWLFTHALSACAVNVDAQTATLSDGICLGLHKDIKNRSHCDICKLIIHALEYGADIEMVNQYEDWSQQEVWINNHFFDARGSVVMVPVADGVERVTRLGIRLKSNVEDNLIFKHGGRQVMMQRILEHKGSLAPAAGRALCNSSSELVQMIKNWTHPCAQNRDATVDARRDAAATVRLIDTKDRCIVRPVSHRRYVVLSYTWGKIDPFVLLASNAAELYKKDALRLHQSRLPVTIQDAISLCAQLGERYLWVDSLCIMQDTSDKHSQIQQMDRVYYNAAWCIVAAAGRDANAGLPGVSRPRELSQRIVDVAGVQLTNLIPPLSQSVMQTFWQKRAWCFQEDLLSLHKVIFTADQTYYHCPHGEHSEDTHGSAHTQSEVISVDLPWLSKLDERSNWSIYCETVDDYTDRRLSFEADALNAFAGVSAFLSRLLFAGCPFIVGIPACSLDAGLLWVPNGKLERRPGFPSWSWAGWKGCGLWSDSLANVSYPRTEDHEKEFERIIPQVQWHLNDQEKLETGIPDSSWEGWKDWKRVVSGDLDSIHYISITSGPRRRFAHPIAQQEWPKAPHNPLLRCTAEVTRMTISSKHTDFWLEEGLCEEGHEICHLEILDQLGRFAGIVTMDGLTFDTTFKYGSITEREFHVMKISQTTFTSQDDPAWDPATKTFAGKPGRPGINPDSAPTPLEDEFDYSAFDRTICWCVYNVLIVSFEEDVATRLAVGRVYYTAFDDAETERKIFSLG